MSATKPNRRLSLPSRTAGSAPAPASTTSVRFHEPVRPPLPKLPDASRAVRRTTPTTPLQPLPPVGQATTHKRLTACEDTVLALITLDPRLALTGWREVLRLLAQVIHVDFDAEKVGRALSRLRSYQQRGWTFTPAFLPPGHDAQGRVIRRGPPDAGVAISVIDALLARYGGNGKPPIGRVPHALRLMGISDAT